MKINYGQYESFSENFVTAVSSLGESLTNYANALESFSSSAVKSGRIHDELIVFSGYVKKLPDMIGEVQKELVDLVEAYLMAMNEAQMVEGEYIVYPAAYSETRDYTEAAFSDMVTRCDQAVYNWGLLEAISDNADNLVAKIVNYLGTACEWFNVRQTQILVMEINDINKNTLLDIRGRLVASESEYQGKALALCESIETMATYVETLTKAIEGNPNSFSMADFSSKLDSLYNDMVNKLEEVELDEAVSIEAIVEFVQMEETDRFFNDSSETIRKYLREIPLTFVEFVVPSMLFQMFEIAKKTVVGWLVDGDYEYNEYILDQEMLAIIGEVSEQEQFDETETKKIVNRLEVFLEYMTKFGDQWEKQLEGKRFPDGTLILDKRTTDYKMFKSVLDSVGDAKKIIKYGSDWCSTLANLIYSYDRDLEILNSVEEGYAVNQSMIDSMNRIRGLYEKKMESILETIAETAIGHGLDALKKVDEYLLKNKWEMLPFSTVGTIETTIDVIGNVTNLSQETKAQYELATYGYDVLQASENAYLKSLSALQNCSPDNANYQKCVEDFKRSFECYRVTQQRMFEKMRVATQGDQSDYYRYCAEEMSRLSLDNHESFGLLSYEEYMARG